MTVIPESIQTTRLLRSCRSASWPVDLPFLHGLVAQSLVLDVTVAPLPAGLAFATETELVGTRTVHPHAPAFILARPVGASRLIELAQRPIITIRTAALRGFIFLKSKALKIHFMKQDKYAQNNRDAK